MHAIDAWCRKTTDYMEVRSMICSVFMQHSYLATLLIIQTYLEALQFYNTCQVHSAECVSKIMSIFSIIFHSKYDSVCLQFTRFACDDCENMCTLSYYYHQVGSMHNLLLCRVSHWYALYVFPSSYKCVIWPVCFLGHSYPIRFCPESDVLSPTLIINSLRPRDAYMRQETRPPLLQIMACRLFGAKPLSEPMLEYC